LQEIVVFGRMSVSVMNHQFSTPTVVYIGPAYPGQTAATTKVTSGTTKSSGR
jgi:hypothetical protein